MRTLLTRKNKIFSRFLCLSTFWVDKHIFLVYIITCLKGRSDVYGSKIKINKNGFKEKTKLSYCCY